MPLESALSKAIIKAIRERIPGAVVRKRHVSMGTMGDPDVYGCVDGIHFEIDDRGELPVLAVFTELQQVLLNFLINAEQAVTSSDQPPRIVIRTSDVDHRARLEVEDSGPGVPRDHEPKLFQPFFTTKSAGEGTGLGLSISYGIIQSHAGTIGYRPAPDGGAIFFFELPAVTVAAASAHQ